MKLSWKALSFILMLFSLRFHLSEAQDYDEPPKEEEPAAPPPALDNCNGIFLSYEFISRTKLYPHLKNATAQAWAFNSTATVVNTGETELKAWKIYIGFQNKEILVSASGAVLMSGGDFPAPVGNGTYLSGSPQADLLSSIETAGDFNQIQAKIQMSGTMFGIKPPGIPMPKTIKLVNDGYECPAPTKLKTSMQACCVRNPKFKAKAIKTKFLPRQEGDLSISYDITQSYANNYLVQVTIDNKSPLGRLDHWNLTWEWTRGEFIYSLKGAFTRKIDYSGCLYGQAGKYYQQMDFSKVVNCEKKPTISDLPKEKANDTEVGKIPNCCRNGSILPTVMDESQSKSVFLMQVFKIPPDLNRTAFYPPEKWNIVGDLNPQYQCGPPIRVDPAEFPDPSGLQATKTALASFQVVCNITRPKEKNARCCVSFSAYYNDSVIPCNTCACGCPDADTEKCNPDARAMLLPPEALLTTFDNRTEKAKAWARLNHFRVPNPLPCPDNCGVSINWHISTDYTTGWTARVTLFNWEDVNFENWFTALQFKKASSGFEKIFSFNGTFLPKMNNTIFFQGLKGLNFLVALSNATGTRVPGKQQSVISFSKKRTPGIHVPLGDGFPSKVLFNGEECSLPKQIPIAIGHRFYVNKLQLLLILMLHITFLLIN